MYTNKINYVYNKMKELGAYLSSDEIKKKMLDDKIYINMNINQSLGKKIKKTTSRIDHHILN